MKLLCRSYVRVFICRIGLTGDGTVALASDLIKTEIEYTNLTEILVSFKSRNFCLYF
jgi:hypothetical protein